MTRAHEAWCPKKDTPHTDAAHRLSDIYNLHRVADPHGSVGKWFASALADGSSDHVLYDSKHSCIRHQKNNEQYYTYIKIIPSTMSVCDAAVMLTTARRLYDAGMRMVDPDASHGGRDVIKRSSIEDMLAVMQMRPTNIRYNNGGLN